MQTPLESRFDTFWPMVGVPQLRGNENVFARDPISGKSCLQRVAHLALVPVSFRAIEVSKSGVQRISGRGSRQGSVGNEGAKAEGWYLARTIIERHSRQPKIRSFNHFRHHLSVSFGFRRRLLDELCHFFRVRQHGQMISRYGDCSCLYPRRFVFLEFRWNCPVHLR
jgi:hypothetical protein